LRIQHIFIVHKYVKDYNLQITNRKIIYASYKNNFVKKQKKIHELEKGFDEKKYFFSIILFILFPMIVFFCIIDKKKIDSEKFFIITFEYYIILFISNTIAS